MKRAVVTSVNPYNLEVVGEYMVWPHSGIDYRLGFVQEFFQSWKKTSIAQRTEVLVKLAALLRSKQEELAFLITTEMGKPIAQSRAEIEKCAWLCEYYAGEAEQMLAPREVATDADRSYVVSEPVGIWLAIMPWNFPFWQVFRCAIPAIVAGNVVVLKHASNVTGCGFAIEKLFAEASGSEHLLTFMVLQSEQVQRVLTSPYVKGVSLTGSEKAGKTVAALAASHIKPSVLELGGSNAFIVMPDADLKLAASHAIIGRFQNNGQSCIAAKRILLHKDIYQEFMALFSENIKSMKQGNPALDDTYIGPLARLDLAEEIHKQVERSVAMGANYTSFGDSSNAHVAPGVLENVSPAMPAFREELFGPVATVMSFSSFEEAIALSNGTRFGLGASVYTSRLDQVIERSGDFHEGALFINSIVKSDPRLPFGGVKASGFGRELSREGLMEFVNVKTIYIQKG